MELKGCSPSRQDVLGWRCCGGAGSPYLQSKAQLANAGPSVQLVGLLAECRWELAAFPLLSALLRALQEAPGSTEPPA